MRTARSRQLPLPRPSVSAGVSIPLAVRRKKLLPPPPDLRIVVSTPGERRQIEIVALVIDDGEEPGPVIHRKRVATARRVLDGKPALEAQFGGALGEADESHEIAEIV